MNSDITANRKLQHLKLSTREDVTYEDRCKPLFSEIFLVHKAFPGLRFDDIVLNTKFVNYELNAPILIEAMTGGIPEAKTVNSHLARLASRFKVAIGLGSQKLIIASRFNPAVVDTYRVVREIASDVPVIGNIGITQLQTTDLSDLLYAMDIVGVDAIAVHLNPAQEIVQPEGDRDFSPNLLDRFRELVKSAGRPVIVKEVGHGLSMEIVQLFSALDVRIFDAAGACGTSWIKIEALRCGDDMICHHIGNKLHEEWWGIPTPLSVVEARYANRSAQVIASGGVWDGIKAAKMLALGSDMVGFARPLLKTLIEKGFDGAQNYLERYISELKTTMFLVGAEKPSDLCKTPVVLGGTIVSYLTGRGIDVEKYLSARCFHG